VDFCDGAGIERLRQIDSATSAPITAVSFLDRDHSILLPIPVSGGNAPDSSTAKPSKQLLLKKA